MTEVICVAKIGQILDSSNRCKAFKNEMIACLFLLLFVSTVSTTQGDATNGACFQTSNIFVTHVTTRRRQRSIYTLQSELHF